MGGAEPPSRAFSQAVFPPQGWEPTGYQERPLAPLAPRGKPRGATLWGVFPEQSSPRMAPLVLGLLGSAGSIPGRFVTDFHRFIWTFLGDYS